MYDCLPQAPATRKKHEMSVKELCVRQHCLFGTEVQRFGDFISGHYQGWSSETNFITFTYCTNFKFCMKN
jgi:hypothetical protein